ncbi:hypothetical protein H5P28_11835 [Ruficoccus amylovorans]|uniref:Lipoprotein n=1 Tax=Ruficoccus amylovorans TaxID=1804625 RepID=A0A842HFY9_9BACT|nr:hypothetical protein [Ruficoccus amylovorans]MBC2594948.1 hypothetical protein [Ruficoccus amylovorans]
MKTREFIFLSVLAAASFLFAGCATSDPASDRISYSGQFGESEVDLDIALPKDTSGKAFVIEGHTVANSLERTSDIVDAGAKVPDSTAPTTASMINDIRGYADGSPVLEKEFQGFRVTMVDINQANNPEVISLVVELNKAISENNTALASEIAGKIAEAIVAGVNPASSASLLTD